MKNIKKIFDYLFLEKEYRVRFQKALKYTFRTLFIISFIVILVFRIILLIFQQITSGFDTLANLVTVLIIAFLMYPIYLLLIFFGRNFLPDVAFAYMIHEKLKMFCIGNRFTVGYTPNIKFSFNDDFLTVKFRLDGHQVSKKFLGLEQQLSNMFVLNFDKFKNEKGFAVYTFRRKEVERVEVSEVINNEVKMVKDSIVLSEDFAWNFRKNPHSLITGITGSGKTFFIAYLIVVMLKLEALIKIIDPKRADLTYLEKYFGDDVAYEDLKAADLIEDYASIIDKRQDEFRKRDDYAFGKDYADYNYTPCFLIFDEVAAFMATCSNEIQKKVIGALNKIILKGRQAGVFVIITMQRPDVLYLPGPLRDQLGLRVGLGFLSRDGYKMLYGSGLDLKLSNSDEKGAGFYKTDTMHFPEEFKTPYLDIDFIDELERIIGYSEDEEQEKIDKTKVLKIEDKKKDKDKTKEINIKADQEELNRFNEIDFEE